MPPAPLANKVLCVILGVTVVHLRVLLWLQTRHSIGRDHLCYEYKAEVRGQRPLEPKQLLLRHGIVLQCEEAIVATSIKYDRAKRRLSPRAWKFKVQKSDCRRTRAWNTTLQKGDPRHEHQILQCKKTIVATHEHGLLHCKKAIVAAKKHNRGTYNYVAQRRYNEIQTMHDVLWKQVNGYGASRFTVCRGKEKQCGRPQLRAKSSWKGVSCSAGRSQQIRVGSCGWSQAKAGRGLGASRIRAHQKCSRGRFVPQHPHRKCS